MSTQKFTTCTQGGNSRPFGGQNNLVRISFNEYVDIIEDFNKNAGIVEAYSKALKKVFAELKKAKAAKNNRINKHNLGIMEADNIPLKYSLSPGMRKESV